MRVLRTFEPAAAVRAHGRTSHNRVSFVSLHWLLLLDIRVETPAPQDREQGDQAPIWGWHPPGPAASMRPSGSLLKAVGRRVKNRCCVLVQ